MTIFLVVLMTVVCFFLTVMWIDCHRFVVREYTVVSDKIKKDGKFLLLSDLHNRSFGKNNEKLIRAIDKQHPDAVLIAGDMYTACSGMNNDAAGDFVSKIAEKYPVYYGNGNHEHKTRIAPDAYDNIYEPYVEKIKKSGVVMLINESLFLEEYGMQLFGLEMDRRFYQKFVCPPMGETYLRQLLGSVHQERYNILIAHNPDYFKDYAAWGADLVVAGHVHGGLMKLPFLGGVISPRLRLFPRYDGGKFTEGKSTMILSRGLGTHTLPIRIFNPGELVVLRMKTGRKVD